MTNRQSNYSSAVRSSQRALHPRLAQVVKRHLESRWREPLHPPSVKAFELLARIRDGHESRIILDSGCGTGESTRRFARRWPDCLVIGVDKSAARLSAGGVEISPHREANLVLLRAELATFWRLALASGWRIHRHYLLYPNPWPKPGQLKRRWHAHPVFPDLLRLGGRLEMRSNWEVYALEFAAAVNQGLGCRVSPRRLGDAEPLSAFERKYRRSGHALYSVVVPRRQSTR